MDERAVVVARDNVAQRRQPLLGAGFRRGSGKVPGRFWGEGSSQQRLHALYQDPLGQRVAEMEQLLRGRRGGRGGVWWTGG